MNVSRKQTDLAEGRTAKTLEVENSRESLIWDCLLLAQQPENIKN